jgi:hypothetical protein
VGLPQRGVAATTVVVLVVVVVAVVAVVVHPLGGSYSRSTSLMRMTKCTVREEWFSSHAAPHPL